MSEQPLEQLPPGVPEYTRRVTVPKLRQPPFWMVGGFLILVVLTLLPLVLAALSRVTRSGNERIHLVQDMDNQPRYEEQDTSPVFADGRAMRPKIPGTVARGQLQEDDHYERGYVMAAGQGGAQQPRFFEGFPEQAKVDEKLLQRGQQRYNIYCAVCHGVDGRGQGPVHMRATELQEARWVPPSDLTSGPVRARPDGHIYNTINNGIRNMGPYGVQIPPPDRWAIVAYVRALQLSANAPLNAAPPEKLSAMQDR